jgi:hypothetical protein
MSRQGAHVGSTAPAPSSALYPGLCLLETPEFPPLPARKCATWALSVARAWRSLGTASAARASM